MATQLKAAAAPLGVTPAGPLIGAEISGVDLEAPLDAATIAGIRAALLRWKVIWFRGQDISHAAHKRFGAYFGPLEGHPVTTTVPGHPEILHIEAADGFRLEAHQLPAFRAANKWHTDVTFRPAPSMGGVLRMRRMPDASGDTLFADTAAIYADLPGGLKARIGPLMAEHDILQSYGYRVDDATRDRLRAEHPPQAHPVVRTHPETGAPTLYVNKVFTTRILGLPGDEAAALLAELIDRVKAPEYQVRFKWSPNAVVFGDNRATQHYAVLDYWPDERIVERVTISGDVPY